MKQDLTGRRFGRWTVIKYLGAEKNKSVYLCRCDCGNEVKVRANNLLSGTSTSCGCVFREKLKGNTWGRTHNISFSPTYQTWSGIKFRCENPNSGEYAAYGGRGITVCERWQKFENFLEDMGERPKGKTIDRIDVNGNYEPSNCRWATPKEQARNRRSNTLITYNGETKTLAEWAEITGICSNTISNRIKNLGWNVGKALTTPSTIPRRKGA